MGLQPTTYSFEDLSGALAHPSLGAYTFEGNGLGQIDVEMDADMTVHDRAADGTIMISKLLGEPGRLVVTVQQTSDLHKWLLWAYQSLKALDSSAWAQMAATLRSISDKTGHVITGISFLRVPPKSYQAAGQRISWTLMAADIQNLSV